MEQVALLDGLPFDPFAFEQDGLASTKIDIGRREIADAFVVALMVVMLDEDPDLRFEIAR